MPDPRKPMRLLAGIVAFLGFNASVAGVQGFLTPFPFWSWFWLDCAATLGFLVIIACIGYAIGLFE